MNLQSLFGTDVQAVPGGNGYIESCPSTDPRAGVGGALGDEAAVMMISGLGADEPYVGPMARPQTGDASGSSPFDDLPWVQQLKAQPWWVWVLMVGGVVVVGGAVLKHFTKGK